MTLSRHQNDALMTSVWPRLDLMWSLIIIMMITGQRLGQDLLILREQNCAGVEKDKLSLFLGARCKFVYNEECKSPELGDNTHISDGSALGRLS